MLEIDAATVTAAEGKIMRKVTALMIVAVIVQSMALGQVPDVPKAQPRQEAVIPPAETTDIGKAELSANDIEAFLDGILPLQLAREDIAGATVAVVKDGKVLFSKGYGFANVKDKTPVSAGETLFRPGSISKLFTWTAVMQLFEQGKLDLDRDINEYLDFKVPDDYGKPITLKDIMTHTAGFDEQIKDIFYFDAASPNLGDFLRTHIPERVNPPGTVPSYSNYATALAGYIVERVSGQPFDQYISEHIFRPLKMTHSTFAQPLPPDMAANMSGGYMLASGDAQKFEVVGPFPAGSLSSTAADMSRFMLAHLQEGRLGDAQILKPETVRLMHSRLFALDPDANAMAYGFYEESRNGHRIIGHGGDTVYFHSDLHLVPDAGLGFFVSYNSAGRGLDSPRTILWEAFLDRYLPFTPPALVAADSAAADSLAVAGSYEASRKSENSFFRIVSLLGEASVSSKGDGTIEVDALLGTNGKPKRWQGIGGMKFREIDGQGLLIFKPDANGRMQLIIQYPFMIFQRVGVWENKSLLLSVFGVSVLVMLLTLLLWPIAWFVRRHYGGRLELTRIEWWLRLGVRFVFVIDLLFIAGIAGFVAAVSSSLELLGQRGLAWLRPIQVIGVLGAAGTLIVAINAVHAWASSRHRLWGKLQATVFVFACLGFLWLVLAGRLLSFTSNF